MNAAASTCDVASFIRRVGGLDWGAIAASLDATGIAATGPILTEAAAPMRHGVSTVTSERRHALGLVYHDAS